MSEGRAVARAIDALRRGWPVAVDGVAALAIETADAATLARFDADLPAELLISGNRAATLKLANQRDGTPIGPVRIARAPWLDLAAATAVADPALDLATPLKGPFRTLPSREADFAVLRLARMAGLLPAFFIGGALDDVATATSGEEIALADASPALTIASRACLPTATSTTSEIVAFRGSDGSEHVALLFGTPGEAPPLVRLHSECLTGDALGSLKCDCGPQLRGALDAIAASGWGILLYLRQEGRGIGLVNKLRAYALQDQGWDTVDANLRLGFADDERGFAVAAEMLRLLGREAVRLLTNNPRKVSGLEAAGIRVIERIALTTPPNPHNSSYLAAKRDRSGHQL